MTDAQVARSRLTIVGIVCMSLFATLFARLQPRRITQPVGAGPK